MARTVTLAATLVLIGAGAAWAGEPPAPLCGRPAVLEEVRAALAQAGRRIEFDRSEVGEVSTGPGAVVSCAVRAHIVAYDTNRYGPSPVSETSVLYYTLERRRNGIFLRLQ